MKTLNPDNWIAGDVRSREELSKPIISGGHKFWTNGYVMIAEATQEPENCSEDFKRARVAEILVRRANEAGKLTFKSESVDLSSIEKVRCRMCGGGGKHRMATCRECNGDGEVTAETDYNSYEVQCASCNGEGREHRNDAEEQQCERCNGDGWHYPFNAHARVLGCPVDPRFIKMICQIEDVQYTVGDKCLFWKSEAEQCFGVIMGLNV